MSIVRQVIQHRASCPVRGICTKPSAVPRRLTSRKHSGQCLRRKNTGRVYCADVSNQSVILKVNAEQLEASLKDRSRHIIVDFYATWCGPCLMMAAELKKIAELHKDTVKIIKVDTDENQQLSSQLKIEGLPTLMFISSNPDKKPLRLEGFIPADTISKIITEEL